MEQQTKNYSASYLYNKGNFEKSIVKFIMSADIVDKNDKSFEDIRYDVKRRQVTSSLMKVLNSDNIILLKAKTNEQALSRSFKVFAASDIRSGDRRTKVFIDCTAVITDKDGAYNIADKNMDIFISYLLNAMVTLIYWVQPQKLLNNTAIIENGSQAFSDLTSHVVDYMRIGSVDKIRERTKYLAALYFQCGIMCKEMTDSIYQRARKISGFSNREADVVNYLMGDEEKIFKDVNTFVESLGRVLKIEDKLNLDNFIERWAWLFGSGTEYGTEIFTAFSSLLTNAYVGAYINNQKTIEKVCGRTLVDYTNAIFKIGSELA